MLGENQNKLVLKFYGINSVMKNNGYKLINYLPSSWNNFNRKITKFDYTRTYLNINNIGRQLDNNKDKIDKTKKLGLYKISF